ncbi:PhzF family phenazine biosynthesis isomerase, partial [Vibrio sp. Vb2362]|nr:PhzF family phenazine biosynthesis isomerase [Vibrio sp. Vb2362]
MEVKIFQVDSFTSEVFKGNPAGVCITESSLDEETMLAIAAEMSLSETAFLSLNTMQLRWFTPRTEVALCGHGTLATAHVLKEQGLYNTGDTIEFVTLS